MIACKLFFNVLFILMNIIFDYIIIDHQIIQRLYEHYFKHSKTSIESCDLVNIYIFVNICITFIIPLFMLVVLITKSIKLFIYKITFLIFFIINVWTIITLTKLDCINGIFNKFVYYYIVIQSFVILITTFFYIVSKLQR